VISFAQVSPPKFCMRLFFPSHVAIIVIIILIIILKYEDLTIEIQRTWNVKTRVIPVIIGATGIISESFRKYVSSIPGNHEVRELQKTAKLVTAHILRKVLT
jgi:hypothetical protein